jgi:multicomponent Na+:H+ antiporter subunit E
MTPRQDTAARLLLATWLTVMWVLLWGDVTLVNVITGGLAGIALVVLFPPVDTNDEPFVVRPLAALSFLVWFLWALLVTNWTVAKEVLLPSGRGAIRTAIVAVPLRTGSGRLATVIANAITLTPGTLTVDARGRPAVLFVHTLQFEDAETSRLEVEDLERRVVRAFGTKEEVERICSDAPAPPGAADADRPGEEGP